MTAAAYLTDDAPYASARGPILRFMREFGNIWWRTLSMQPDGTRAWPTVKTRTPEFVARLNALIDIKASNDAWSYAHHKATA